MPDEQKPPVMTPQHRQVFDVIGATIARFGYAPTLREISDALGYSSPSTTHRLVVDLERLGYIRRLPKRRRAIEIVSAPGETPLSTALRALFNQLDLQNFVTKKDPALVAVRAAFEREAA